LRQHNQSQQQSQAWKPGNQLQSNARRPPQDYKPPQSNTIIVVSSGPIIDHSTLTEQLYKFLPLQPHAMSFFFIGQLPHSSSGMSHSKWIMNSGASYHMFPDSSYFVFLYPFYSCHDW
jgi:hypothetical protein